MIPITNAVSTTQTTLYTLNAAQARTVLSLLERGDSIGLTYQTGKLSGLCGVSL